MATSLSFRRLLASRIIPNAISASSTTIAPTIPLPHLTHSLRPLLYPPIPQYHSTIMPHQQHRFISQKPPRIPRDEEIIESDFLTANFVDHDSVFHGLVHVPPLLDSIDRSQYALVLINPGDGTPANPAIIKQFTHAQLAQMEVDLLAKAKALKETRKKQSQANLTKQIQFTWAISNHDLLTKMKKAGEFLQKGQRVEITISGKKGMTKVTRQQVEDVVRVVDELAEEKGGREWRDREGTIGAQLVMYYEKGQRPIKKEVVENPENVEGQEGGSGEYRDRQSVEEEKRQAGAEEVPPTEQNIPSYSQRPPPPPWMS